MTLVLIAKIILSSYADLQIKAWTDAAQKLELILLLNFICFSISMPKERSTACLGSQRFQTKGSFGTCQPELQNGGWIKNPNSKRINIKRWTWKKCHLT